MPMPIIIKAGDIIIPAILNDTVAANEFKKRLPFKASGYRSKADYCCYAACGVFDPSETQCGWKNGDIGLAGSWFTIHFDGEEYSENYHGMMIIAHIEEENLPLVKTLPANVKFVVELV